MRGLINNQIDGRGHAALYEIRNEGGVPVDYADTKGSMLVRVIGVNWARRTVDCVGMHNQTNSGPWLNVPVLASVFSQSEGIHWLPYIDAPTKYDVENISYIDGNHDAVAIIMFVGGNVLFPVCVGFLAAGPNEFSFDEPGTKIERHASDIYTRIAMNQKTKEGLYEFSFPDGTYIKVANPKENKKLTELSKKNMDAGQNKRSWTIEKDDPKYVMLHHSSGCEITVDQLGNVSVSSPVSVSITAPTVNITATNGNVIVGGKSLTGHTHNVTVGNQTETTTSPN
jgi:hypothetical protein